MERERESESRQQQQKEKESTIIRMDIGQREKEKSFGLLFHSVYEEMERERERYFPSNEKQFGNHFFFGRGSCTFVCIGSCDRGNRGTSVAIRQPCRFICIVGNNLTK